MSEPYLPATSSGTLAVKAATGYLAAITSASFCFGLFSMFVGWKGGVVDHLDFMSLRRLLMMSAAFSAIFWLISLIVAALPFLVGVTIANLLRVRSILFYLLSGALMAALIDPVFLSMAHLTPEAPDTESPWLEYARSMVVALPCGLSGGLAYWATAGRYVAAATS